VNQHPSLPVEHLIARFDAESTSRIIMNPNGGIILDASHIDLGDTAICLVLVVDLGGMEGGRNNGRSVTNALDSIIDYFRPTIHMSMNVENSTWVQRDTLGCFDYVLYESGKALDWKPLVSGIDKGRTEGDFISIYGRAAEKSLQRVVHAMNKDH
jgi:hypothetical protein